MNPIGRVPILEEPDGNLISDSSVICDYLERVHPAPPLFPADPRLRARALWLEEYADTKLVEICARVYWMHVLIPARSGQPVDWDAVKEYVDQEFPPVLDYFESCAPDTDAIVDGQLGIADIALASPIRLLSLAGNPLDALRWPRFDAYTRRVLDRRAAVALHEAELHATEVFGRTGNAPTSTERWSYGLPT
jgi:glutathione S-transferase